MSEHQSSWSARPIRAALVRAVVFTAPIAASIAFVQVASRVVATPGGSFWLHLGWWLLLGAAATGVLVLVQRASRRLLPLAALYRLSLVFPDQAPSRFRVAMRSGDVSTLEQRVERARRGAREATPVEAAERLLELVADLDVHDRLTRGHSERVRAYAQLIGRELRLPKRDLDLLNWAALVHDVGKLEVPTEILTKPGRPTDAEWRAIRGHPELGDQLVAPLRGWLGDWAAAVRDHHERWDGAGYPDGKAGEEIALAGRIVAVADVFDVITSTRSYKRAGSAVEGRSEIARCAGTQFDPRVVRAFLGISLGRARFATGPLSWLAHAPLLGRLPLSPALGSVAGSAAVVATAVGGGLVAAPQARVPAEPVRAVAPVVASAPAPRPADPARASKRAVFVALPAAPARPGVEPRPRSGGSPSGGGSSPASPTAAPSPVPPDPGAPSFTIEIDEDSAARVRIQGVSGSAGLASLSVVSPPPVGKASMTAEHELVYDPPANFHGAASLGYQACWSGASCAGGRVGITVRPVNDAPAAAADKGTTSGAPVTLRVLANDADVDGDRLTVSGVEAPPVGSAGTDGTTVTYLPPPGFSGSTTFRYTVVDPGGSSAVASVEVSAGKDDQAPVAVDDAAVVVRRGSVTIDVLANDVDPEGGELSVKSLGKPSEGTVARSDKGVEYTPTPGFTGTASFPYVVADPAGGTDEGLVTVAVVSVNAAPVFDLAPGVTLPEDSPAQVLPDVATRIDPGGADDNTQSVTFDVSSSHPDLFAAGGQPALRPDGTLTFTPAPHATGTATVTVHAVDDGGSDHGGVDTSAPQTLALELTPVNDAPVAVDDVLGLDEDDPDGITFSVCANDVDVDLSDVVSLASHDGSGIADGTLTPLGGCSFSYVPASGMSGAETFTYTISDGNGGTDAGSVTLQVAPQPDTPEAADDAYVIVQDTPLVETAPGLLGNDADQDAQTLTAVLYTGPANGSVVLAADGSFTYTPNAGFAGTDSFVYKAKDPTGVYDVGTVTITVSATFAASTFFLQPTGSSPDTWDLATSPPPAASPVPDHDGDGDPGLWIKKGNGDESDADPRRWHEWKLDTASPLVLNGPVSLELWSGIELFDLGRAGHPYVYLYDCAAGGTGCTLIAQNDVHVNLWNGLLPTWVFHEITIGSVDRTVAAGRELRVCLRFDHDDLWVAMTAAYPSALVVTLG